MSRHRSTPIAFLQAALVRLGIGLLHGLSHLRRPMWNIVFGMTDVSTLVVLNNDASATRLDDDESTVTSF
jgi:hypothetical protein